jgi:hypothetical protein
MRVTRIKIVALNGEKTMKISVIPWHVFTEALLQQEPSTLELWLRRWLFTNEGVIIAHEKIAANQ